MKRFETFGEYMFDLLFAPLKKGKRTVNQFYILFKIIGRVFDGLKKDALRVRDETNVVSASPVMLPVHGQDRDMLRFEGESIEAYRTRLAMKGIISEWSGVNRGILYALAALGYEQSRIEPIYEQDPEHWAEFIIFLKGRKQSGVNNVDIIIAEVNRVKEGSSKLYEIHLESPPMLTTLHMGGAMAAVTRMPIPEAADDFCFEGAARIGGQMAAILRLPVPEMP